MGGGTWSGATYSASTGHRIATGTAFGYTKTAHATGTTKVHEDLDPAKTNADGKIIRESRDSDEHPTSKAIAVLFDHTASMGHVPMELQKKLPNLLGLILRNGYVEDPQILFGSIGDATCNPAALQLGQFESDNRMDEALDNLFLYGGGGGQMMETYELAAYFLSKYASMDCLEKRGEKGYLFITGDECNYPTVNLNLAHALWGEATEGGEIPTKDVYDALQEKFEVFFIMCPGTAHFDNPTIINDWRQYLPESHILKVETVDAVPETIAMTLGIYEGTIGAADIDDDLKAIGADDKTVTAVKSAVTDLVATKQGGTAVATKGATAVAVETLPDVEGEDGIE